MNLLTDHPEQAQRLRAAGYAVESDDDLVAAFSAQYSVSQDTARLVLAGSDDVQTVESN